MSIKNPFDPQREHLLEWYFEAFLKLPFVDTVKAEKAAMAIRAYGEALFEQVFGERRYSATMKNAEMRGSAVFR